VRIKEAAQAAEGVSQMRNLGPLAWAWMIIVGGILLIPPGPIPIVHDRIAFIVMGVISIVLGVAAFVTRGKH
jgi:hypothetical protein